MTPIKLLVRASIFAFLGLTPVLQAQDSVKVVIISPRVGSTIDEVEGEYYHIFSQIKGFRSAQFLLGTDGLYYARVSRTLSPGVAETDTIIEYPERSLLMMAEKINHFEALKAGEYKMGSEPAQLEISGQSVGLVFVPQKSKADSSLRSRTPAQPVLTEPRPKVRSGMLPITKDEAWTDVILYPSYGIGFGISSYSPNLAEFENAYAAVERYYAGTGHPVYPSDRGLSVSPMLWLALYARFSSVTAVTIEGGLAPYNTQIRAFSALLLYYPEFLSVGQGQLRPFGGIGVARYQFRSTRKYGQYVSQNVTLDEVSIEARSIGMNGRAGVEYIPSDVAHIQVFASYLAFPEINANTLHGTTTPVHFSSFQAGLVFIFYF